MMGLGSFTYQHCFLFAMTEVIWQWSASVEFLLQQLPLCHFVQCDVDGYLRQAESHSTIVSADCVQLCILLPQIAKHVFLFTMSF